MTDRDCARALSDGMALPLSPFSRALFLRQNYDEEKHLLSSAKRKEARKKERSYSFPTFSVTLLSK